MKSSFHVLSFHKIFITQKEDLASASNIYPISDKTLIEGVKGYGIPSALA